MSRLDYAQLIDEAIERLAELAVKKEAIDIEISKLRQFVYATLHMLPEDVSRKLGARVKTVLLRHGIDNASLTNAVRTVMQTSGWRTVGNVRKLQQHGFDFSEYKTNSLASVATTLRCLKDANDFVASCSDFAGFATAVDPANGEGLRRSVVAPAEQALSFGGIRLCCDSRPQASEPNFIGGRAVYHRSLVSLLRLTSCEWGNTYEHAWPRATI